MGANATAAVLAGFLVPLSLTPSFAAFANPRRLIPIHADSHGHAAVFARLVVPLRASDGLAAFTNLGWVIPVAVDSDRGAAVGAVDVVPLGVMLSLTRLADARRVTPVLRGRGFPHNTRRTRLYTTSTPEPLF